MMGWIFAGGILFLGSIYDAKNFSMPLWLVILGLLGGGIGLVYSLAAGDGQYWEMLVGLLPGILSLLLAFFTGEQIGYGDGLLLFMLGCCLGGSATLGVWFGGLLISFVVSILLLAMGRAKRSSKIPFVPCLFMSYVILGMGGILNGM